MSSVRELSQRWSEIPQITSEIRKEEEMKPRSIPFLAYFGASIFCGYLFTAVFKTQLFPFLGYFLQGLNFVLYPSREHLGIGQKI